MSGFGLQGLLCNLFIFRCTLKLIKIIPFGLVQTKPVRSKTASLRPGPVRPSGETGPDKALPQTGSVCTGGLAGIEELGFAGNSGSGLARMKLVRVDFTSLITVDLA